MSWVKRLVALRPFQQTAGIMAAEYLRLVWKTTRFVVEPEGIYEQFERDAPVIIAMWHGQHFSSRSSGAGGNPARCWSRVIATARSMRLPRNGSGWVPFGALVITAAGSSAKAA